MILTEPIISPYAYAGFVGKGIGNRIAVKSTAPEKVCERVANAVCEYYGLTIEELKEKCRKRYIVKARQISMHFMRNKGITLEHIGKFFGKDHTTVIHACATVQDLLDTDEKYISELTYVKTFISIGN